MPIYQPKPTYYRITWTLGSPTDYNSTGGISPLNSLQFANSVVLTGNVSGPTMTTGNVLLLNNVEIGPFNSADTNTVIIARFNDMVQYTGVMASENWTGYITLQSVNPVDAPILIANKTGTPAASLGLPLGVFSLAMPIYGGSFTTLTNGQSIILNGVTITFATGGLNIAGACAKINSVTSVTGVVATPWTNKIQLNTIDTSPIYFGNPGSGTATANLGFAVSTAYSNSMTLSAAQSIEKANMRWKGIVTTVETSLTAFLYGSWVMSGGSTTDGADSPDTVAWTLGVENIDHVYAITETGEPETVGTVITGVNAIKRLVARALTLPWAENRNVFNDTLTVRGVYALRENPVVVQHLVADPVDTVANIATIEGNISVVLISNA